METTKKTATEQTQTETRKKLTHFTTQRHQLNTKKDSNARGEGHRSCEVCREQTAQKEKSFVISKYFTCKQIKLSN